VVANSLTAVGRKSTRARRLIQLPTTSCRGPTSPGVVELKAGGYQIGRDGELHNGNPLGWVSVLSLLIILRIAVSSADRLELRAHHSLSNALRPEDRMIDTVSALNTCE
jgi:hypothetical protein